jgi:hypothetical protein
MYKVELSENALADLDDFSEAEVQEILAVLLGLEEDPKPSGVEAFPIKEAADRIAYLCETDTCDIFYNIFELAQVVKVVAIFKRTSSS